MVSSSKNLALIPVSLKKEENLVLTFSDFILGFMAFCEKQGRKSFPAFSSHFWHVWLYEAKKKFVGQYPQLEIIGEFDWDREYPTSRRLEEVRPGLCYKIKWLSPYYSRILLRDGLSDEQKGGDFFRENPDLVRELYEMACGTKGFLEE